MTFLAVLQTVVAWMAAHPVESAWLASLLVNALPDRWKLWMGPFAGLVRGLGAHVGDAVAMAKKPQPPPRLPGE